MINDRILPRKRIVVFTVLFVALCTGTTGLVAAQPADIDTDDLEGSGTDADPYVITTASELQAIEDDTEAHYILGNDIDASGTATWNDGNGFAPISDFEGNFDGNQHTISGLSIDRPTTDDVGLFGEANGAIIENVHLSDVSITGESTVGGLVGDHGEKSITRSVSTTGAVAGGDNIGGIVGYSINSGVVTQSYSTATVQASVGDSDIPRAGGLVGGNYRGAVVNKSYATGDVKGGRAGGLVGENFNGSRVANSYATGKVTALSSVDQPDVGGLVGGNYRDSTVANSYWDTETSGQSTSDGDATGLPTAEMTGAAAAENMARLDFDTVWQTQTNPAEYPTLRATPQVPSDDDSSGDPDSGTDTPIKESEVSLAGGTITVSTGGVNSISVSGLPSDVNVTEISDGGTYNPDEGSILYTDFGGGLPETVTFRLTPGDSYSTGDTISFTVDGTSVTIDIVENSVPSGLSGDVTSSQYSAVAGDDSQLSAPDLSGAINSWASTGTVNGVDIGAPELSALINYWANN